MAEPAPWDAPQQPETPPWGSPEPQEGLLSKGIGMLGTSEGRSQLLTGVQKLPMDILKGTLDWFETPGKAVSEGLTSDEEIGFAANAAIGEITGKVISGQPKTKTTVAPEVAQVAAAFKDSITEPVMTRLDSYARTGDPNGVRLDPPQPEVKPSPMRPVEYNPEIFKAGDWSSFIGGVPTSIAAKTGIPEVDSVLHSPVTRAVIDNAVIDRQYDVPYMAGGSEPLNDPTVYVDRHVPHEQEVDGIRFDPAQPWSVHENVEQHTMEILTRNGMPDEEAYRVAHFEFAEPAEQAWYRAHGIDQEKAEAEQMKWLPRIQHENPENPPPNLYEKPYPHDHVQDAEHEGVTETPPTAEEKERAFDIIRNAPELQPKSAQPMLQQARELGVIGDERQPSLNELPPKEAGRAAMNAGRPPDRVTGEISGGPERTAWRKRWEARMDNIGVIGDARDVISAAVDANDEFVQARQGNMSPAQIEQIGSVTGLDTTRIDVGATSSKIKNNVELRNTVEAFGIMKDKIKQAAIDLRAKKGLDDEAELGELTKLELQRDMLLDAAVSSKELIAVRAEFAREGHTLNEFYKAQREANGLRDFLKAKEGKSPDDVRERARLIADTPDDALPKVLTDRGPKKPGWVFWGWQNGLISGEVTHTKYAEVNTATVEIERTIAPELAAIIGKMRGDKVSLMAPLWANIGMVRALPDAFTGAVEAFKTGARVPLESEIELTKRSVENPELKGAQVPYTNVSGPDWGIWKRVFNENQLDVATKVLGWPGRQANFLHTFYKILSERGAASSRAYEAAWEEGAKGDEFTERYQHHLINPTDEALKANVDDAYSGAFMEKLGDRIGSLSRALATNPVTKWLFPFQHIPWNIERMTARYSPAPLIGAVPGLRDLPGIRDMKMVQAIRGDLGRPAQNLAYAKVVIGSTLLSYFALKGYSGDAHGGYPVDEKTRREWAMMGIQPNSTKIHGDWYSLERFAMPGNLAKMGAGFGEIVRNYNGQDDPAMAKAAGAAAMVMVNQIADETGFQTTRNFIDVVDGRQSWSKFAAWQAGSFLPFSSLLSQTASIMDPEMRVADGLVEGLKYRIPYLRETLLPKRDPLYGEPLQNPGYHTLFRQNPVNADPVKDEIDRVGKIVGWFPGAPQRTIGKVRLDNQQYDRYEATAGPYVKELLSAVITTDRYKNAAPENQAKELKGWISYGRASARQVMQGADPAMIKQGIDNRTRQITGVSTGAPQ